MNQLEQFHQQTEVKNALGALNKYLGPHIGNFELQPVFEELHRLTLMGMGYGLADNIGSSGEKQILSLISRFKFPDPVVFDVGANVGGYSKEALQRFGDDLQLYSFEPSEHTFRELEENTRQFKNIKRYNFGLGHENGAVPFYGNEPGSGLASVFNRRLDYRNRAFHKMEDVQIVTLDSFCEEKGIDRIHFLKLDVEGNELNVLKGAENMLERRNIDFIQFEFGGCNIDARDFFQDYFYFLKEKYRIYRILPGGIRPIDQYREELEVFVTVNFFAVLKEHDAKIREV